MPFLHLDADNLLKPEWHALVKDHPVHFEVLEWTVEQNYHHLRMAHPELDTSLFSADCIEVLATIRKLVDYGGIVVRGAQTTPIRGLRSILDDWRTLGPPKKMTVRGASVERSSIMVCGPNNATAVGYCTRLVKMLLEGKWNAPKFDVDVELM